MYRIDNNKIQVDPGYPKATVKYTGQAGLEYPDEVFWNNGFLYWFVVSETDILLIEKYFKSV